MQRGRGEAEERSVQGLRAALDRALQFVPADVAPPPPATEQMHGWAAEEAAQHDVSVDDFGLTNGMQRHLLAPWLACLAGWRAARAEFDRLIEPHMADIRAVELAGDKLRQAELQHAQTRTDAEQAIQARHAYTETCRRYEEAAARFEAIRHSHGNRVANMGAYNPLYGAALLLIGFAEWQINYRTFESFLNIPAIAAGTTAVLGAALAFAAHGHGTLLKQWQFRFGPHRDDSERFSPWRFFALATVSLIVVLMAAGGSRYSVALSGAAQAAVVPDITGAGAVAAGNPMRDVLISLLGNIGAWLVGVFLAYLCHDTDGDFMDATHQYQLADRRYRRARRPLEKQWQVADARLAVERGAIRNTAASREEAVATQLALLTQVRRQERAVLAACLAGATPQVERYRDLLCGMLEPGGGVLSRAAAKMTPHEYRLQRPDVAARLAEALQ